MGEELHTRKSMGDSKAAKAPGSPLKMAETTHKSVSLCNLGEEPYESSDSLGFLSLINYLFSSPFFKGGEI